MHFVSDRKIHYSVAFIGGFFGIYSILSRCDFLGSAQTSNLLFLVRSLLGGNILEFFLRIVAMALYIAAIVLHTYLNEKGFLNIKKLSMLIDSAAILLLGFLPENVNLIVGLYPVFFAMAFQWCSFRGVDDYTSATVFSTNNLRQFSTAATLYLWKKEEKQRDKAKFYGGTLLGFHLGAGVGYVLFRFYALHSIWFALVPAATVFAALEYRELRGRVVRRRTM